MEEYQHVSAPDNKNYLVIATKGEFVLGIFPRVVPHSLGAAVGVQVFSTKDSKDGNPVPPEKPINDLWGINIPGGDTECCCVYIGAVIEGSPHYMDDLLENLVESQVAIKLVKGLYTSLDSGIEYPHSLGVLQKYILGGLIFGCEELVPDRPDTHQDFKDMKIQAFPLPLSNTQQSHHGTPKH